MAASDYDVFISYARQDNATGWVSALKALIDADARSVQGREYRVFFDTEDIHRLQDWWARILGALRTSKVLLVCLSPAYFASEYCRWEWKEYAKRQARLMSRVGSGASDDGTIATVFFVATEEVSDEDIRAWRDLAMRIDGVQLQPWFEEGPKALLREEVRERVADLGTRIWQRVERANQAEAAIGNLLQFNPFFVGRTEELRHLRTALVSPDAIGVVTAVHGLGGLGKTELTVQYAHAFRDVYRAGVWQLRAEGHELMLPLLATLADEPAFEFAGSDEASTDPVMRGREVLAELQRRIRATDGGCLLILDNVSEPALLVETQTAHLPASTDLSVVVTTRLGDADFRGYPRLGFVEVGALDHQDGLTLIRDHQPKREHGQPDFATAADEQAASAIVELLDGFTLAIEQIAIFLGRNEEVSPQYLLRELRRDLRLADQTLAGGDGVGIRHQQRTLAAVLATTLADLDQPTQATLRLASLLPPESVPWPWLRAMLAVVCPDAVATSPLRPKGDWPGVRRALEGRRLLTAGADPDLARMHRLHAAHLADDVTADKRDAGRQVLIGRAAAINDGQDVPTWEYGALLDALIERAADDSGLAAAVNLGGDAFTLLDRSLEYVGDGRPSQLALLVLAAVRQAADAQPGNLTAQRDLSISLTNVARMLEATDPATALDHYQQSLTIRQSLAGTQPGNQQSERDLLRSLHQLAQLSDQAGDQKRAHELWQRCAAQLGRCRSNGWLGPDDRMIALAVDRHLDTPDQETFVDMWLAAYEPDADPALPSGQIPSSVLDDAGLASLSSDAKVSLLHAFEEELQLRVGEELASGLTVQQLDTFESLQGDQEALAATVPGFEAVVGRHFQEMRQILASAAPTIRERYGTEPERPSTQREAGQAWTLAESLEFDPDHGPDDLETLSAWAQAGELYASLGRPSEAAEAYRSAARGHQRHPSHGAESATTQRLWALALHSRAHTQPMLATMTRQPTDQGAIDHAATTAANPDLLWTAIDHNPSWQGAPRLTAWLLLLLAVLDAEDLAESLATDIQQRLPQTAQAVADEVRAIDDAYLDEPALVITILEVLRA